MKVVLYLPETPAFAGVTVCRDGDYALILSSNRNH
jgi:hypothetical protein